MNSIGGLDLAEWHDQRKLSIGASEAAAVLGLDPFSSALEVWGVKTGRLSPKDEEEHMRWGHILEPVILEEYSRRNGGIGVRRFPQDQVVRHPRFPAVPMGCTPDGEDEEERLIQIKTTSAWMTNAWRDEPPLHVQIQEQAEMAVMGRQRAVVAALVGGNHLELYELERNDAFIKSLEEHLQSWWYRYVVGDVEPPATSGDEKTIRALEKLHPDDSGEEVLLSSEYAEIDEKLVNLKQARKAVDAEIKNLENKLKGAIGAATFGLMPGVRYSWKTQERSGYVVSDAKFRVLRRTVK